VDRVDEAHVVHGGRQGAVGLQQLQLPLNGELAQGVQHALQQPVRYQLLDVARHVRDYLLAGAYRPST
jgi:hypothetical protein